jgi:hypothetical protein
MPFHSFDQTIDVVIATAPMSRAALEVKCFDELGGKCDCTNKTTEVKEGIIVANSGVHLLERSVVVKASLVGRKESI